MNTQSQVSYLLSKRRQTSHGLHLVLTLLSWFLGAMILLPLPWWGAVWALMATANAMNNLTVDRRVKRLMRGEA